MRLARLLLVPFAAMLTIGTALAADGRKIDFTTVITDEFEQPMWECSDATPPEKECHVRRTITLGRVVFRALATPDQSIKPEEGFRRGQLGLSLMSAKEAEIPIRDVVLIKDLIAKVYSNNPLLLARCYPLLDPSDLPK